MTMRFGWTRSNTRSSISFAGWIFWYPARNVIPFKRRVYSRALQHLEPMLPERSITRVR